MIINDLCQKIISRQDGEGVCQGVENLINSSILVHPWLTRNMVFGRLRRLKEIDKKSIKTAMEKNASSNSVNSNTNKTVGRPNGSTNKAIQDDIEKKKFREITRLNITKRWPKDLNPGASGKFDLRAQTVTKILHHEK